MPYLLARTVHALCSLLLLALPLSCLMPGSLGAQERIVFVSHAPDTDTWWNTIKNALKHASEDFGIQVEYRNPKTGSIEDMAKIIEEAAASKPSGIITTIADYSVLRPVLTRVTQTHKIPLVTVNSGNYKQSESVNAIMHIGQPEYSAGFAAGEKAYQDGARSFVCLNHNPNNAASHERCKGFADGLQQKEVKELEMPASDQGMESTIAAFLARENVDAILSLGPQAAQAAVNAIKPGKPEKPPMIVTFDLSNFITAAIARGKIAFAIDQQPYLQGYLAVGILSYAIRNKGVDEAVHKIALFGNKKLHARMSTYDMTLKTFGNRHVDSGPGFVTRGNVDKVERYSGTYR